jgi:hypothetical protein
MLRAVVLLSSLRRILRFSTTGRPGALGACYVASWQSPRLDFHQQVDDSLSGHTSRGLGALSTKLKTADAAPPAQTDNTILSGTS